jgi:pyruvate-formate lyase-activating enzyme
MELDELVALRPVPSAGVLVAVTNRCPLHCAHCSASSTPTSRQPDADALVGFVDSFRRGRAPRVLVLTGGEPLLRPGLVVDLAERARSSGTATAVLTGAFFAVRDDLPDAIRDVIDAVDHFSVSIDVFHEREVPRASVFRLLHRVIQRGTAVSIHAVGSSAEDGYLDRLGEEVDLAFDGAVPILANTLRPVGRAALWSSAPVPATPPEVRPPRALPCAMAAWPVVAADGTVLACCNQLVVDRRPVPAHLRLGHIAVDGWERIAAATLDSPLLRLIRTTGPEYLAELIDPSSSQSGHCASCRALDPAALAGHRAVRLAAGPAGHVLDVEWARRQTAAGAEDFLRRHASSRQAGLVHARTRGHP